MAAARDVDGWMDGGEELGIRTDRFDLALFGRARRNHMFGVTQLTTRPMVYAPFRPVALAKDRLLNRALTYKLDADVPQLTHVPGVLDPDAHAVQHNGGPFLAA